MSNTHNNTHNTHPHLAVQPIEVSQYTYDTSNPSELATHSQDPTQHSATQSCEPIPSRVRPVEQPHDHKHDKHDKHDKHPEAHHHPEPHPHPKPHHQLEPQHAHRPEHHYSPSSPTSTIESDSVQSSPVFGNAERRQSWSKDEMKRGVIQDLLEKGKGKQAKGGYSSTSWD